MKKSIWIFLLAILTPGIVLGWLALRSAEEQQIIFERRTAELYQKETDNLAEEVRQILEGERREFGDIVHRLLANGDAEALARDFTNTLADAWPRNAVGFALAGDGRMLSPSAAVAARKEDWREFLWNNSSFLSSAKPAAVYAVPIGKVAAANQTANLPRYRGGDPGADGKLATGVAPPAKRMVVAREPAEAERDRQAKSDVGTAVGFAEGGVAKQKSELAEFQDRRSDVGREAKPAATIPPLPSVQVVSDKETRRARTQYSETAAAAGPLTDAAVPEPRPPAAPRAGSAGVAGAKVTGERDESAKKTGASQYDQRAANKAAVALEEGLSQGQAAGAVIPGEATRVGRDYDDFAEANALGDRKENAKLKAPGKDLAESKNRFDDTLGGSPAAENQPAAGSEQRVLKARTVAPAESPEESSAEGPQSDKYQHERSQRSGELLNRLVQPEQQLRQPTANWSSVVPATADFSTLTARSDEGMVSRFVQDRLELIFWIRPPEAPEMIFGCLVEAANLGDLWTRLFAGGREAGSTGDNPPFVLALLDDKARPVGTRPAGETGRAWKMPFVASEIGEALPHWEAALYLATPTAIIDTARGFRRTLSFTIVGALALIALGGWLVVADVRRQLALAQQKTDFVSNVSHELKTPLTSIRMFAELLHDRPPPQEKQGQYLRIITVEAERLTRLINNVLDFAKLERKQRRFEKKALDLHALIARVWEGQEMHLQEAGFATKWEAEPGPYPVVGDEDALAQILVNLLSNAEKYSRETKEVELVTWIEDGRVNMSVLDRGLGVPDGEEKKIFEAFYRAHDSLSSGIQGSGLGLTLACRLAAEQGGDVHYERRQGGGSRFTLRVPLAAKSDRSDDV